MCLPTLFAMIVIGCFALCLVFLSIVAFAHFALGAPLATNMFNYLLRRKAGVLDICGRQVVYTHKAQGKNGQSSLELVFAGKFFARAVFHTESRFDRLGKEYGLNEEIQLNDPAFDEAVYIECDDALFVRNLLAAPEAKAKLRTLLDGFTSLEFKGDRCILTKSPCDDFDEVGMAAMTAASLEMLALADRLMPASPGQNTLTPLTESRRRTELVFTAGGMALLICGIVVAFWGSESFEPVSLWESFKGSLPAALLFESIFLAYLFLRVRGTSTGLRVFRKSLVFGGLGIVLWCWGWFMVLNGSQDNSRPVKHEVRVLSKHYSSGKGGNFRVGLSSWTEVLEVYKLNLRRREYDLIEIGDSCFISVKKGFFGLDWIDGRLCQGRGRAVGSGNVGGEQPENSWRLSGGFFREIPPPIPQ